MAERFFSYVRPLAPGIKYGPITGQISLDISLDAITQPKTHPEDREMLDRAAFERFGPHYHNFSI